MLGDVEDHAVGIFELAFEIAVPFLAEIEEEFAAVGFDAPLRFSKVVEGPWASPWLAIYIAIGR